MDTERKKVAFHTLGCKLNFAETSTISRSFPEEKFERVAANSKADIYVINTCSVTDTADKKCRQAIKKFIEARKNIKTLMSYHSYSSLVLYPWAGLDTPVQNEKDRKVFETMAKAMAGFTGYTPEQSSDLYVATGDTTVWAYSTAGIFAFTTELEGSGFYHGPGII